jgi:hypothetical protein
MIFIIFVWVETVSLGTVAQVGPFLCSGWFLMHNEYYWIEE